MSEPANGRKGVGPCARVPQEQMEAVYTCCAIPAIMLGLGSWPVQLGLFAGSIPPSHCHGLAAVIAALVPILYVAAVYILGFLGLAAEEGPPLLKTFGGVAMVIAILPSLAAPISACMFLAQF